jgi:carbonic anhydrase/acetyltransferase-like protein (isoleucine patch superfamily)
VADSAQVMGACQLGRDSSVWFGATDARRHRAITVGAGSNIQDGSVLHADVGYPLTIGERVTVGHQVMLHGCTIGDESLIGIGAVVLNGAKHRQALPGGRGLAGDRGQEFPRRLHDHGQPGQGGAQLTPEQIEGLRRSAQHYIDNARRYRNAGLKKLAERDAHVLVRTPQIPV